MLNTYCDKCNGEFDITKDVTIETLETTIDGFEGSIKIHYYRCPICHCMYLISSHNDEIENLGEKRRQLLEQYQHLVQEDNYDESCADSLLRRREFFLQKMAAISSDIINKYSFRNREAGPILWQK